MSSEYIPQETYSPAQKQILSAAIDSLVELGYAATSIGGIAKRLGISKGLIHYHFSSKEILFQETIAYIYSEAFKLVRPPMDAATGAWSRIEQFIVMSGVFYKHNPFYVRALSELRGNFHPKNNLNYAITRYERELSDVALLLREGQRTGEFRSFDVRIMALTLRQSLNGIAMHLMEPDYDIDHHADELVTLFRRGLVARQAPRSDLPN